MAEHDAGWHRWRIPGSSGQKQRLCFGGPFLIGVNDMEATMAQHLLFFYVSDTEGYTKHL